MSTSWKASLRFHTHPIEESATLIAEKHCSTNALHLQQEITAMPATLNRLPVSQLSTQLLIGIHG
jgi:hypothetical protein